MPPSIDHPRLVRIPLLSPSGIRCEVSNLGASLHRLDVPDRHGHLDNIVLGYDTIDEYLTDPFFIGATVGRVANRIAHGAFELEGKRYELETNNPPHHLHGGSDGWFRRAWTAEQLDPGLGSGVVFSLDSETGDAGYPGNVHAEVSYLLRGEELHIVMTATSDAITPLNLAHHSYFNLAGQGDVLGHQVQIASDEMTPGSPVPDGSKQNVEGSVFDLRAPRSVGAGLPQEEGSPAGFDHNYLLHPTGPVSPTFTSPGPQSLRSPLCEGVVPVANVFEANSGRLLELSSNQPAVQFYTGNYLDGRVGAGRKLDQYGGLCLETQAVPNFINLPEFRAQGLLAPGSVYRHELLLRFSLR